jgi:hypothetical protein
MITYTKLRNGEWGVRGEGLVVGQTVTVTKKSGETKTEKVAQILSHSLDEDIASIVSINGQATKRRRNWRPCGYPGCNPSYCDECDGRGYES